MPPGIGKSTSEEQTAASPAGRWHPRSGADAIRLMRRGTLVLVALDGLGLLAFVNLAYLFRLGYAPGFTPGMLVPLLILWLSLYVLDAYVLERQVAGMRPPARAVVGIGVAGVLSGAAAYAGGFWSVDPTFGRGILPVALAALAVWSACWRLVLGAWLRQQSERIRWLVIGTGEPAAVLKEEFARSPWQGELVFVASGEEEADALAKHAPVRKAEELEQIAREPWSGIVVALARPVPEPLVHRLMKLRFSGVRVYGLADFYEQLWYKVPVMHTQGGWLVFAHGFDLLHNPLGLRVKRILDIVLAVSLLVVASPLMALVALLIRLDSKGPAIFRQLRTGLEGAEFELLKFRSMTHDAERDGPQWAQASDPRVTRVGRIIRLLRIDELPQLINVIKGEMSFIGPRPERPVFNAMLEEAIPLYDLRHLVRPGITGWAQVMYPYGASIEDARQKLQYDLYYIKNYSVLLDIGIIFKTLRVVLLGKGR